MEPFAPQDPNFIKKVEESFDRQEVMKTIHASLLTIAPGNVSIKLPYRSKITQQHGFVHAGIISTVIDSACGYAALTLMPDDAGVLSIEFKVNLLAPAKGDFFVAHGLVRKPGRTILVTEGELVAHTGNEEKVVATMVATMMCVTGRNRIKS